MRYALNVAPVNGTETHAGSGTASLSLQATGDAMRGHTGVGQATMALTVQGDAIKGVLGAGQAAMTLSVVADTQQAVAIEGQGQAAMVLTARHGIPRPTVKPATFAASHKSRVLAPANDNRVLREAK